MARATLNPDSTPRLSMVMIARNSAADIDGCFASFWDHVDEVVLVDTGSRDGTIGQARRFAKSRGEARKLIVGRFKWCDDFGAARTYAHSLATGDVHCWTDTDELLHGAQHLRDAAAELLSGPEGAFMMLPRYDAPGRKRPRRIPEINWIRAGQLEPERTWIFQRRLLRPPVRWTGRLHEVPCPDGDPPLYRSDFCWLHEDNRHSHAERNLAIAQKWATDEPTNPAAATNIASEYVLLDGPASSNVEAWCQVALGLNPPLKLRVQLLFELATVKIARDGDQRAAAPMFRELLALLGDDVEIDDALMVSLSWFVLGHVAIMDGDLSGALRCADNARRWAVTDDNRQHAALLKDAVRARRKALAFGMPFGNSPALAALFR